MAADHAGHRCRAPAGGRPRAVRRRPRRPRFRRPSSSTASTSCGAGRRTGRRSGSPTRPTCRPSGPGAWPASWPRPTGPCVYGRIGLCNQEFGTLASWLVDVVNILTAALRRARRTDVPAGRGLAAHPPADARPRGRRPELRSLDEPGPRCARGARPRAGVVPGRGDRHARRGPDPWRCSRSPATPCSSTPGGDRLDEALPGLDCMISIDNWINETTRHADVILPGLSALEQAHHDDLIWQFAVGSGANYSAPIFPPTDGRPEEWEILIRLAGLCLGQPGQRGRRCRHRRRVLRRAGLGARTRWRRLREGYDHGGPERLLDLTLRTGPFGDRYGEVPDGINLDKVKAEPHGIDLGPKVPRLADVLQTPHGQGRAGAAIHHRRPTPAGRAARPTGRGPRAHQPPAPALEQLVDAQRARAGEGQGPVHAARAPDRRGAVRHRATAAGPRSRPRPGRSVVAVEVTDAIKPGVVSLPHGWGHDKAGHASCRWPTSTPA